MITPIPVLLLISADSGFSCSSSGTFHVAVSTDVLGRALTRTVMVISGCADVRVSDSEPMVSIVPYIFPPYHCLLSLQSRVIQQMRMHVHHSCGVSLLFLGQGGCKFTPVIVQIFFIENIIFVCGIVLGSGACRFCFLLLRGLLFVQRTAQGIYRVSPP